MRGVARKAHEQKEASLCFVVVRKSVVRRAKREPYTQAAVRSTDRQLPKQLFFLNYSLILWGGWVLQRMGEAVHGGFLLFLPL